MKFYSEMLDKFYDNAAECEKAEKKAAEEKERKAKEAEKKANERQARAAEVEEAIHAAAEALDKYHKLLEEFCRDYGAFHYSIRDNKHDLLSLLDWF